MAEPILGVSGQDPEGKGPWGEFLSDLGPFARIAWKIYFFVYFFGYMALFLSIFLKYPEFDGPTIAAFIYFMGVGFFSSLAIFLHAFFKGGFNGRVWLVFFVLFVLHCIFLVGVSAHSQEVSGDFHDMGPLGQFFVVILWFLFLIPPMLALFRLGFTSIPQAPGEGSQPVVLEGPVRRRTNNKPRKRGQ